MLELEVKLMVPPAARERVLRALRRAATRRTRLQAAYFDTADRALAAQHVALRMRKEGAGWVQTAKAQGDDPTVRLEHNVPLGRASRAGALPTVDPARHRGTPVGQRLDQALSRSGAPAALLARYRTDILRLSRERRRPGARLELAFDEGRISAGLPPGVARLKPTTPRVLSLCELEIECLSGSSAAVFDEAGEWIERHGLWLDTRSKALRGERLALGGAAAPRAARALTFSAGASLELAWVELHRSALSTVLDNASDLAAGLHSVEHVHQLRVGLNRLRAAWRLFEDSAWSPPAPLADAVQHVFHVLGRHRDRSIWARWRERMRQALGQDLVRQLPALPHAPTEEDPLALLRSPAVNLAWLQWLRLCAAQGRDASKAVPGDAPRPTAGGEFVRYALRQLRRWQRRALRDIETFAHASDGERHRLRKRLKRMRYVLEMLSPALPARALKKHMSALRRAESQLGEFNDLVVCQHMMEDLACRHAVPGPALDWLAKQRKAALKRCARSLRDYARTDAGVLTTF